MFERSRSMEILNVPAFYSLENILRFQILREVIHLLVILDRHVFRFGCDDVRVNAVIGAK